MSGNNELIKKIRDVIEKGGNIDVNTRDVLLFSAVVDIYESIDSMSKRYEEQISEIKPALTFYKVGMWISAAFGLSFIGLVFGMLTGQVQVIFK